jgi:cytochrome P450
MSIDDQLARLKTTLETMEAKSSFDPAAIEADASAMLDKLKQHALQYPEPVFAVLRRVKPVLIVKGVALITRFADVQDVLTRDDVFAVTYGPKMRVVTGGQDFFLGMANSPDYERDTAHMRTLIRRSDIPGIIVPFVAATAERLVAQSHGTLEVVSQLTLPVPALLVANYYGCEPTSLHDLESWASTIFQYLFTDLTNDPAVDSAARAAAANTRAWLDAAIARQKSAPTPGDTVLNRSLALQQTGVPGMDDITIRNNLLGILTGAIPTTSKCCAQALDELLKRPAMLAAAQAAAVANDDATLAQYVFEALRFNPNNPGVFRIAAEDYVVAKGTPHATLVPKGTSVLAATQSAMFDDTVADSPNDFRIDRPGYIYMHWGVGLHTCFGQYINQVQIPAILKPLLQRKNLRRADGPSGTLQYTGPFPSSLSVLFDEA